ncbi:MAG: CopD family protein [Gemmatimonadota bacterium]|nr:CopD family protein [Gemmatimonadota bacterium]
MLPIHPLLQAAEEQVTASGLALEYAGFLAYFGVFGALGFFWFVLQRTAHRHPLISSGNGPAATSLQRAETGAATIGVIGALFMIANLLMGVAGRASEKAIPFMQALTGGGSRTTTPFLFALAFLVLFAVATKRVRAAWILAALVALVFALRNITSGKWTSLVNPLHEVAASLWIGSLFVLVFAGLPSILRSSATTEQRGSLVADLVASFSSLAIGAVLLLVATGITTAWRHLKFVAALWTTSYGYALDTKLVFVAIVAALGAWNWRRMRPRLGTEAAAHELRSSASRELFFAAIVLVITGVLVSLPGPRLPHP